MTAEDPLQTRRESTTSVASELDAAGFTAATEIGRGGFGVVYRCTQQALDRTVAVKILTGEATEENRERFVREQRAMGRLTGHPNIVPVLEAGVTDGGRLYLVTPYYASGSLDNRIRRFGPLSAAEALQLGVKIAGALESAHRAGIVHRDVKPGNILLTDYGEPTLTDFGIAQIAGGFRTAEGTVTGSPAYTAPEVLEGSTPTPAADVYGLGATLFSALTGHAAFERRTGEKIVTQFLRITTQPVPDLREHGIAGDITALVETAMNRDPRARPAAARFGENARRVQQRHGYPMGAMALRDNPLDAKQDAKPPSSRPPGVPQRTGNLPLELTSLVNRRTESAEVKNLLSTHRLVTLTGVGGVGKTRLALRVATQVARDYPDGVWLVDLADVSEASILVDVIAAAVGVRDESAVPLRDVLVEFLCSRNTLLVLDNCEQLVQAVAELNEQMLRVCPDLRVLVTSREPLNIAGEAILRIAPLTVPGQGREPSLKGMPRFDSVTLFAERAAAVVPGFELDETNKGAVAGICSRLEGLPLAIELAAARMRTLSPQQILQRLNDRYALLTQPPRTAPTRQQTLRLCIDWSYELCTPAEQQLWSQLAVFAGSCELDAVEAVCEVDTGTLSLLDVLSSLVDKSILAREESGTVVRYRMLETLRDYGRQELRKTGRSTELRRRHHDWCRRLTAEAAAGWISAAQPDWIARLEREQANLRDALEYCLSEDTPAAIEAGMRTATGLYEFWNFRGLYGEGRSWLDRFLSRTGIQAVPVRVAALCAAGKLTASHGEFPAAAARLREAHALAGPGPQRSTRAQIAYAEGLLALSRGEPARARKHFELAVESTDTDPHGQLRMSSLTLLGWAYELSGDTARAGDFYRNVLAVTEPCGEVLHRAAALRGLGVAEWQHGTRARAQQLLTEALQVNSGLDSKVIAVLCLEALAWTVDAHRDAERAAVLMGAAHGLSPAGSQVMTVLHNMWRFHDDCAAEARRVLGDRRFDTAHRRGAAMNMSAALSYALGAQQTTGHTGSGAAGTLTKRERQVADLVAQGLSNKQIAAKLVVSQRTAQSHVEHILTKLGFNSRAQIAAWITENAQD